MPNDLWCQKDPKVEFTYLADGDKQQVVQVHITTGILEQPVPHKQKHQPMQLEIIHPADWSARTVKEPTGTKVPLAVGFRTEPNGTRLLFKLYPNDEIKSAESELRMDVRIPQTAVEIESVYEPTENIRLIEIQVGGVHTDTSTWS